MKFCMVLSLLGIVAASIAQSVKGEPAEFDKGITETVAQIMARPIHGEGVVPEKGGYRQGFFDRPWASPSAQGSCVSRFPLNAPKARGGGPYLPQTPGISFTAVTAAEALSVPPDPTGGVSTQQILAVVNGRIRVFDKLGQIGALDTSTDVFFASVAGTWGTRSARVRFDRLTARWFISMLTAEPTNNRYVIAVSNQEAIDATTQFTFFSFRPADISGSTFDLNRRIDGVSMGVDANALYFGAHVFAANFVGTDAFVVKKSSILGTGPLEVSAFRNLTGTPTGIGIFAPQGVDNDDPSATEGYFVGTDNGAFGRLIVCRVSDPGGTPILSSNFTINVPSTVLPRTVNAQGSSLPLAGGDDRLQGVRLYRNHQSGTRTLWAAHSIQVNASGVASNGGGRNGIRWYQLDNLGTTPILLQSGTVFDSAATTPLSFWMPSNTLSGQGHLAIGSNVAGVNMQVGVAGSGRYRFDAPGASQAASLLTSGAGTYNVDSFSPQRWGSGSQTVLDPSDAQTAWTFQTFVNADNHWALRVVQLKAPAPPALTPAVPGLVRGVSQRVGVAGVFANGSEFFDPGQGYPNHLSVAITGPGVTISSFELATPTQLYLDLIIAPDAEASVRTLTVTNPDGQTSTVNFEVRNPLPEFYGISPTSRATGSDGITVSVLGAKFVPTSVVRVDGVDKPTTYVSETQMTFEMSTADLAVGAARSVTIFTPGPGGGTSNSQTFNIVNPQPTMTSLDPVLIVINSPDTTVTVTGTNFVTDSTVKLGDLSLTTTYVSATQVTCVIPASELLAPRNVRLRVFNPAPGGGGATNDLPLTIGNPVPTITTFTPNSAPMGSGELALTVNGTNFVATSFIRFAGVDRATTVVSSTELTTVIPASEFVNAGTRTVRVVTPAPGGGIAGPLTFNVTNPEPTLSAINPDNTPVNSGAFTLTVTGTNFLPTSVIRWNGLDRATTYLSDTSLSCTIPSSFLNIPGYFPVTVFNPSPGGGQTTAIPFAVTRPAAVVTTLSPNPVLRESSTFTLTVNGNGFFPGAVVRLDGQDRPTTYVSATRVTAEIPGTDLLVPGPRAITVNNPGPGDASNAVDLNVHNPIPAADSVAPDVVSAGSSDTEITISGALFFPESVVRLDNVDLATVYDSPTQLRATVPSARLEIGRTAQVTVFNPTPGGGVSATVSLAITNPVPTLTEINPADVVAGGDPFTLTVTGTNFVPTSQVTWNQLPRTTTFVSSTQLTIVVPAGDYANAGSANIRVRNPLPGGGTAGPIQLRFSNPVPVLETISPTETPAGSGAITLTVTGSGFVTGSFIRWNGLDRGTTFINRNTLRCTIPASFLTSAGDFPITVWNNTPGGGTSNPITFSVTGPPPTLVSLNPSLVNQYDAALDVTVNGTGFAVGAVARVDGQVRPTTVLSATQLTVRVEDTDMQLPGERMITVRNPGSSPSNALALTVAAALPILDSVLPEQILAGGPDVEVTLAGDNFVPNSVAKLDGIALATTYDNVNQLRAVVPASMTASGRFANFTVFTPAPGGGESGSVLFVINNPVPTLTEISPNSLVAGTGAFNLIVRGTNFTPTSVVTWNQVARPTTFVSSTELHAAIPASDVAAGGSANVRVFNPTPGGGTAGPLQIQFVNSAPAIAAVSPPWRAAGGGDFTLTVTGTGFSAASVVTWRGSARVTTFVSPTELQATILAADYAAPGTANVRVFNPAPGGGTTEAYLFSIGPVGSSLLLPSSFTILMGEELDGGLESLFASDNLRLQAFNDPFTLSAQVQVNAVSPVDVPTAIMLESEVSVERSGVAQTVHMYNYLGARWQLFESATSSPEDRFVQVILPTPAQFVGPNREIQYRVTWTPINDEDPTQDGWLHRLDTVRWFLAP